MYFLTVDLQFYLSDDEFLPRERRTSDVSCRSFDREVRMRRPRQDSDFDFAVPDDGVHIL